MDTNRRRIVAEGTADRATDQRMPPAGYRSQIISWWSAGEQPHAYARRTGKQKGASCDAPFRVLTDRVN